VRPADSVMNEQSPTPPNVARFGLLATLGSEHGIPLMCAWLSSSRPH
jgi:hypothetical protein